MPFEHCAGFTFSTAAVSKNAPAVSGVYGISNAQEWIFVGEADNIRDALLAHLRETDTLLRRRVPTGFTFEICGIAARYTRQDRLVLEYEPVCNRRSS
jgi:hypothetical protein